MYFPNHTHKIITTQRKHSHIIIYTEKTPLYTGTTEMNHNQFKQIEYWLTKANRKPLIIRGARQVGKSTLVQLFAEQQRCSLTQVNLERYTDLTATFKLKDTAQLINVVERLPDLLS